MADLHQLITRTGLANNLRVWLLLLLQLWLRLLMLQLIQQLMLLCLNQTFVTRRPPL